jgi:signal transduction histidine kinase/CheY-like chemotaxis protein
MIRTTNQEYDEFTLDMLISNSRSLIWTIFLFSVGVLFFLGLSWGEFVSSELLFLIGWICLVSFTALRLLEFFPRLAAIIWLSGLWIFLCLAISAFHLPSLNTFFVILPFLSIAMMGLQAGLPYAAVNLLILFTLAQSRIIPALSEGVDATTFLASGLAGLAGWAAFRNNSSFTRWAFYYAEKSRQVVDETRAHQLELEQTREDLLKANQELSRLSKRMQALQQVAEEARQAKAEFVANVSHELRAPLNLIIGYSQMIARSPQVYGTRLPASLLADINTIWRNSQHLSRLVDDILDLSQVEAGRMSLTREKSSLAEIILEAISIIQPLFTSKELYLETDINPDLPYLFIDRTRIRQIMINLLSNAGRFTEHGGVKIVATRQDRELLVKVSDSGPGIAQKDLQRLFTPFEQVDVSLHRKHGGSGLGLSICKHFVELHGGRIWLESQLNLGTTVFFTLPLEPVAEALVDTTASRRWVTEYSQPPDRVRPWKVILSQQSSQMMVVEFGDTLHQLMKRYMDGVEVLSAPSVAEALQQIQQNPVQALLVNSPAILNPEAARGLANQLEQMPFETPTIACYIPGKVEAIQQLGVQDYLIKPVSAETLIQTVTKIDAEAGTILIVDDDPDVLKLFARILKSYKPRCRLLQANNGHDALEILRDRHPDIMLLDLVMDGKDGYQVLEEKRKDPSIQPIPVVIISSRDPKMDILSASTLFIHRVGGLEAGELIQLIAAVNRALSPAPRPDDPALKGTVPA